MKHPVTMSARSTDLSRVFKALGDPSRLAIFELIRACSDAEGQPTAEIENSISQIASRFELSLSTVSHHIKELRGAGLIRCERRGQSIFCSVAPEILSADGDWRWVMLSIRGLRVDGGADDRASVGPLDDRFDMLGWGLVFLLVGALALPNGAAEFASVAVVGALILGLNVVRVVAGTPVRRFSVVLGVTALTGGLTAMAGLRVDVFVLFFVLLGLVTIADALLRSR